MTAKKRNTVIVFVLIKHAKIKIFIKTMFEIEYERVELFIHNCLMGRRSK